MDHSFMHTRRASSSVFSFKAAAASLKVKQQQEEEEEVVYDDSAEEEDEEGEEPELEETYPKKKRMDLGGGYRKKGSATAVIVVGGGGGGGGAGAGGGGGGTAVTPLPPSCQVDKCAADLTDSKRYHQRHKVCEYHSKAQVVIVAGLKQRFCQQCSRFHDLSEFDDTKRSCRRRLAGHNERRRKHFSESRGEGTAAGRRGSTAQIDKKQCRQVDERGRNQIALSENPQNFHIH